MQEQDVDISLKCIVVGNGRVGKTSMIQRFAKGVFTGEYKKTLAVDFLEKKMVSMALQLAVLSGVITYCVIKNSILSKRHLDV